MQSIISIALLAFLCCVIFSVFYWEVFHVVVARSVRFHLFSIRDEARRIAADRGLATSFAFQEIERFVNKAIRFGPHISLVSFLWFITFGCPKLDDEENKRFLNEAPKEFHNLRDGAAKALLIAMMLNSPWAILFGSLTIPVLWAKGMISRFFLYRGAEVFVDRLAPESAAVAC